MISFSYISCLLRKFGRKAFGRSIVAVFVAGAVCGAWIFGDGGFWATFIPGASSSAPHISMTAPPMIIENKTLLLSYDASDDAGLREITLRMTPRDTVAGGNNAPVEVLLSMPATKKVSRTDSQSLAAYPWAGKKVTFQIVATNGAGKKALTDGVDFTLPLRQFFHPLARVLIEERDKLLQNPEDIAVREEAANIMASIAHQPSNYSGDPVILMALRGGAVRLVLGHDRAAALSVTDILWQAATRVEDGGVRRTARDAQRDLPKDF